MRLETTWMVIIMKYCVLYLSIMLGLLTSCSNELGEFFDELTSLGAGKIILVSANSYTRSVTSYEMDGSYSSKIIDYNDMGSVPRGLAKVGGARFIVALDAQDRLEQLALNGESELFGFNAQFNGTIYDVDRGPDGNYYVLESNYVEKFSADGERSPPTGSTPFIATTLGSCVISNPRSISFAPNGYMYVATIGGGDLVNIYDISTGVAQCVDSIAFTGLDPQSVLAHSNGYVYVGTNSNDRITRMNPDGTGQTVVWDTNTTVINNPWSMVEMSDGTILVSSAGTDSIEQINPDGTRVGNTPYIKDGGTFDVTDILIMEASD